MDHTAYIDAAAATLGLKITAEQRPGGAHRVSSHARQPPWMLMS